MSEFVEVKTQDLSGAALDWAVAQVQIKAGEITPEMEEHSTGRPYFNCKFGNPSLWGEGREQKGTTNKDTGKPWVMHGPGGSYSPSTDWSYGGPLIEKYGVDLSAPPCIDRNREIGWQARPDDGATHWHSGETALIAAMRSIVAAKIGNSLSVPKELLS